MDNQDIQKTMAELHGNPHFEAFLDAIAEIQEQALWDLESFENLDNAGFLQRVGGILHVTREIARWRG